MLQLQVNLNIRFENERTWKNRRYLMDTTAWIDPSNTDTILTSQNGLEIAKAGQIANTYNGQKA